MNFDYFEDAMMSLEQSNCIDLIALGMEIDEPDTWELYRFICELFESLGIKYSKDADGNPKVMLQIEGLKALEVIRIAKGDEIPCCDDCLEQLSFNDIFVESWMDLESWKDGVSFYRHIHCSKEIHRLGLSESHSRFVKFDEMESNDKRNE